MICFTPGLSFVRTFYGPDVSDLWRGNFGVFKTKNIPQNCRGAASSPQELLKTKTYIWRKRVAVASPI